MKNWIPITGVVALLAAGSYWLTMLPGSAGAKATVPGSASAWASSQNATTGQTSDTAAATAASATPGSTDKTSSMQATTYPTSGWPVPSLTRAIDPPQTLQIEDRKWSVLGTRDVTQGARQQTVLVLRDEASGQLNYRQSALRFVLQPGADYEAFIRERRNAQRLFVNVLHGEIAVDAANIAAEYATLASDKRVVKVQFMPLVVLAKPR